ncbi:hypothetical protein [Bacillus inaquosorum]|uniref:hypothetical protein n=1 Tax=Bacillus inaquosorum TaxID=483913 RepID=UPI002280778F|nr:hypothetical protein [Bacillus inaquosorum]MCY8281050.1 hypothetical protein [Bacillus inaquosorum]
MFSGEASDVQIAAFLIAERIKTESPDELLGITEAMRACVFLGASIAATHRRTCCRFCRAVYGQALFSRHHSCVSFTRGKRHTGISSQQRRASAEICNKPEQKRGLKLLEEWISASSKGTNLQF